MTGRRSQAGVEDEPWLTGTRRRIRATQRGDPPLPAAPTSSSNQFPRLQRGATPPERRQTQSNIWAQQDVWWWCPSADDSPRQPPPPAWEQRSNELPFQYPEGV